MDAAIRVLRRYLEAGVSKSAPKKVEPYFKKVKDQNPDYSDSQAWATAWSIYCKHKKPDDKSCHQDDYFTGKQASPALHFKGMSMLFVSDGPLPPAVVRQLEREPLTIQNLESYEEADIPLRVLDSRSHEPIEGARTETRVDLQYPIGTGDSPADMAGLVRQLIENVAKKHRVAVGPCSASHQPRPRT
jgi:hypothetical protein